MENNKEVNINWEEINTASCEEARLLGMCAWAEAN